MSMDSTRPAGRRDQRRPQAVPPQRSRRLRPHRPPRPHQWFAERLLAVLSGQRPVHWMLGHTIGDAYDQLAELAPSTPLGAARGPRPVLRHCHGAQPASGVVEAFASITAGDRVQAMAFRLEQGPDQRWRCAAVELGGERLTAGRPGPR
ncbi:Rv3235 family protein [Streptomyces microflavus]|uniref:Rv3235 family protein n=1 Tax=Streptomyces microflavus TaxID=1919 RepID=UPI003830838F|nr:Rv3235 family protein [Streptomyces microflavus]WST15185.1 Rv3235 family protein [Streptomyces microflavus]